MAVGDSHYDVKYISFLGRPRVAVLLQNENGPCPLLAMANVLLLQVNSYVHLCSFSILFLLLLLLLLFLIFMFPYGVILIYLIRHIREESTLDPLISLPSILPLSAQ